MQQNPRKVDELGRVVLPKELRNTLGIKGKSPLEIFVEGEDIILQKYQPGAVCVLTGEVSNRNIALANGKITLSPEGAELLIKEIEQYLQGAFLVKIFKISRTVIFNKKQDT